MSGELKWGLNLSILASLSVVLLAAFKWSIIDRVTPFLFMLLAGAVWIGFFITAIASLACLKHYKKMGAKAAVPVSIQILAFLLVMFAPLTTLWLKADFLIYKGQRDAVVRKVYNGELVPNVAHNLSLISLNSEFSNISMGGNEIVVEEHDGLKYVFFYTFRGILENYSGFIYVPDKGNPALYSDLNERETTQIVHLEGNWYYASHR